MNTLNKTSSSSGGSDHSFMFLALPYEEFDVWVTDVDEEELEKIGRANEVEHLGPASFGSTPFPVTGAIFGRNIRYMAPLVCQWFGKPNKPSVNIWFLVDTGSPFTSLSMKALKVVFGKNKDIREDDLYYLAIEDPERQIECRVSKNHFQEVNILGADTMRELRLSIMVDWDKKCFQREIKMPFV